MIKKNPPCNLSTSTYSIFGIRIATSFYWGGGGRISRNTLSKIIIFDHHYSQQLQQK